MTFLSIDNFMDPLRRSTYLRKSEYRFNSAHGGRQGQSKSLLVRCIHTGGLGDWFNYSLPFGKRISAFRVLLCYLYIKLICIINLPQIYKAIYVFYG